MVTDHLKARDPRPDTQVATVYCGHEVREEQTLDNMLLSIIHQVLEQLPAVPQEIQDIYKKGSRSDSRNRP
jgi:hypothetical protein